MAAIAQGTKTFDSLLNKFLAGLLPAVAN